MNTQLVMDFEAENMSQCHFVNRKTHKKWPGAGFSAPLWETSG
jgi:hypothetical protein